VDDTGWLVPDYAARTGGGVEEVKVASTHPGGFDSDHYLPWAGAGVRELADLKFAVAEEYYATHI
jgi:hypothetical protein